ncbi:MAG: hypothetical protein JST00_03490 [Deltaproteobacteria bacterium]|nr:hypothetical protein [Deltaproteobacteria bacterium]
MNKTSVGPIFTFAAAGLVGLVVAACSSTNVVTPTDDGGGSSGSSGGEDAGADTGTSSGGNPTQCTAARKDLLLPIDKTSNGQVKVISESGGTKTVYVDATAGGFNNAVKNPRIYVDLSTLSRVDKTDVSAPQSTDWDLSLKRVVLYTNGGDAGIGQGGAAVVSKAFASVTAADADAANIKAESFFDAECTPKKDRTDAVLTTFSDWYDYDDVTRIPTPKANTTYIVRGAKGKRWKVAIKAYDANPDGTQTNNTTTGGYLLLVADL